MKKEISHKDTKTQRVILFYKIFLCLGALVAN